MQQDFNKDSTELFAVRLFVEFQFFLKHLWRIKKIFKHNATGGQTQFG